MLDGYRARAVTAERDPTALKDRALNPLDDCPELARFGRFGVLGRLGRGGMSLVYLARDIAEDGSTRHFALKTLLPERVGDPAARARFAEEARVNAALRSEHTCRLFEHGEHGEHLYLATEYVWGPSLGELLSRASARRRPVDWRVVVEVIRRSALALEHIHSEAADPYGVPLRLVHSDVAPDNILLRWEGGVRLIDLGVASAQSHLNAAVGKYPYLSPEMVASRPLDARSDLFSLGAVLYEALVGAPPFERASIFLTMQAILGEPTPAVRASRAELPEALDHILARAMAKDVAQRYASGRELAHALEALLAQSGGAVSDAAIAETLDAYFVNDEDRNPLRPGADQMLIDGTGLEPTALAEALRPVENEVSTLFGDDEDEVTVIGGRDMLAMLAAARSAPAAAKAKSFARPRGDVAERPRPQALGGVASPSPPDISLPPRLEPVAELAPHPLGRSFHALDRKNGDRDVLVYSFDSRWSEAIEVFEQNRAAIAAIVHPNVWPMPEVLQGEREAFVSGPLPRGPSLHGLIARGAPLSRVGVADLLAPVASALDQAHAAGLPHALIDASYVRLDRAADGVRPVLSGIGFGALYRAASHKSPAQRWPADALAGLAPEVFDAVPPGPASDVFALGVLALRLMGAPCPFEVSEDLAVSLQSKASMTALLASADWGPHDADEQLRWVLAHALAPNPSQRYQSCGGWVADLGRALKGEAMDGVASRPRAVPFTLPEALGAWCLEPAPPPPDLGRARVFVSAPADPWGEDSLDQTAIFLDGMPVFERRDAAVEPAPTARGPDAPSADAMGPYLTPPPESPHAAPVAHAMSPYGTPPPESPPAYAQPSAEAPSPRFTQPPAPTSTQAEPGASLETAPRGRGLRWLLVALLGLLVLTAIGGAAVVLAADQGWPPAARALETARALVGL